MFVIVPIIFRNFSSEMEGVAVYRPNLIATAVHGRKVSKQPCWFRSNCTGEGLRKEYSNLGTVDKDVELNIPYKKSTKRYLARNDTYHSTLRIRLRAAMKGIAIRTDIYTKP